MNQEYFVLNRRTWRARVVTLLVHYQEEVLASAGRVSLPQVVGCVRRGYTGQQSGFTALIFPGTISTTIGYWTLPDCVGMFPVSVNLAIETTDMPSKFCNEKLYLITRQTRIYGLCNRFYSSFRI